MAHHIHKQKEDKSAEIRWQRRWSRGRLTGMRGMFEERRRRVEAYFVASLLCDFALCSRMVHQWRGRVVDCDELRKAALPVNNAQTTCRQGNLTISRVYGIIEHVWEVKAASFGSMSNDERQWQGDIPCIVAEGCNVVIKNRGTTKG